MPRIFHRLQQGWERAATLGLPGEYVDPGPALDPEQGLVARAHRDPERLRQELATFMAWAVRVADQQNVPPAQHIE